MMEHKTGLQFFIAGCNTLLGYSLIDELRNDHMETAIENIHQFAGTLDPTYENDPPLSNVSTIVTFHHPSIFKQTLDKSDIIIYHLPYSSPAEIRFVTDCIIPFSYSTIDFRNSDPQTEKILILISTVLLWQGNEYPIRDHDFPKRKSPLPFLEWRQLENDWLTACRMKDGKNCAVVHPFKKSFVICPGLLYGLGEEYTLGFSHHFLSAWNYTGDTSMDVIGEGTNKLPTIHIKDLCKMVRKIVEANIDPQDHPYLLAVDKADQTQYKVVESIAKKFGVERIEKTKIQEFPSEDMKEIYRPLTINVKMVLSEVLDKMMIDSEWHCKNGFIENLDKVFEEYRIAKGLRSLKIMFIGPPLSGKTHFAELLSKKYGIGLVKTKETIESATNENSEFGENIRKELEEVKTQKLAELALMAKKKKVKVNADLLVIPRHTSGMLCKIYSRKLNEKAYQNKGFILDGFPKCFPEAAGLFLEKDEENKFMPNKVILIEAAEETLYLRVEEIPEEERKGTHYEKDAMTRRITEYKQRNDNSQGYPPLAEFFAQRGVEVLKITAEATEEENCKLIQDYIEKDGMVFNNEEEEKVEVEEIEKEPEVIPKVENVKEEKHDNHYALLEDKVQNLLENEKKLLELRSYKMRKYMTKKVIPILGEGILEICKSQPLDPINSLAEYLIKKSSEEADEEKVRLEQKRQARALLRQQRLLELQELEKKKAAEKAREEAEKSGYEEEEEEYSP